MTEFTRRDVVAFVLLAGLAAGSWLPRLRGPIDLRWDGGTYYVLGTSLAQGHGYRLLNEPGEILATQYPPMLPVIVAAHQLVLGTSDFVTVGEWLRRSFLLLFVAYAIAVYAMLRRFLPLWYAVLAALVPLLQLHTIFMSDLSFPEIPFGLATVLAVLCSGSGTRPARRVLSGTLAMIAFALRTVGVALLAAWVCDSLGRRDFKQMGARMLIAGAVILGWAGYIASVESSQEYQTPAYAYQRAGYNYINVSYARQLQYKDIFSPELGYSSPRDRVQQFVANIAYIPVSMGEAVSTYEPMLDLLWTEVNRRMGVSSGVPWLVRATLLFLGASVACGIGLLLLRRQYFIPLYLLFSLAMVCATPWPGQFNRYLTPLAPFLSLSFFLALRAGVGLCARRFPARSAAVSMGLAGTVAMSILACQAVTLFMAYAKRHPKVAYDVGRDTSIEYRLFFYEDLHRATDAGLDWLKRHADGGAVLATTDTGWAYLRTGLKSVIPPFELDARKAQGLLDDVPVRYLVVDEGNYKKYTTRVVAEYPDRWRRVFADTIREEGKPGDGRFEIYERIDAR